MYRSYYPHSSIEDVKETMAILEREEKVQELLQQAINLIGLRGVLYYLTIWVIKQKQKQESEQKQESQRFGNIFSHLNKAWMLAKNPEEID